MPDNHAKAQGALAVLKEAVLAELESSANGLTNADIVKRLGLESDYGREES